MTETAHNSEPAKRRWYQFRLRTLLIVMTLFSIPFAWIGSEIRQRRREKRVIAWVEKMDGCVEFKGYEEQDWWSSWCDTCFGVRAQSVSLTCRTVTDLSPLVHLAKLKSLRLGGEGVTDLSALADITTLKTLNLSGIETTDFSPLADLESLNHLVLETRDIDFTTLPTLKNLTVLSATHTQVGDLSGLSKQVGLERLGLWHTRVSDLSPLSGLKKLKLLWLSESEVSDLSPLAEMTNLQTLLLDRTRVNDISPLAALSNLDVLFLNDT